MLLSRPMLALVVVVASFICFVSGQQLSGGGFLAAAGPGASSYPLYNIPAQQPLPQLKVLNGSVELHFKATQITV